MMMFQTVAYYIIIALALPVITASLHINSHTSSGQNDNTIILFNRHNDAQKEERQKQFSIADIDRDGITDSLFYDFNNGSLVFLLSTREFAPQYQEYDVSESGTDIISINAEDGGFSVTFSDTRSWSSENYLYQPEINRFRLSNVNCENFGNTVNNGSGTWSLDLINESFNALLSFYDYENDTLITYPAVSMIVENDLIYLGDSTDLHMPGYEFFERYRDGYMSEYCDTVKFLGFNYDYDYSYLVGEKEGGEYYSNLSYADDDLNRGDIVSVCIGTHCHQEPGDKDVFYVSQMIWEITTLEEGKLSQFYKENQKSINYHTIDWWDERRAPADVEYFLANTTDKKILEYLHSPGILEVEFIRANDEQHPPGASQSTFLARITNLHDGISEAVCNVFLDLGGEITFYYILDAETGEYVNWY